MLQAYLLWVAEEMTMSGDKISTVRVWNTRWPNLAVELSRAGRTVEIVIYGGSALLLTLNRRSIPAMSTRYSKETRIFVRSLAAEMAEEFQVGRKLVE